MSEKEIPKSVPKAAGEPSAPAPLVRDIRTIGRYSRHNDAEDMRFRSYLKGSDHSDAQLDAVVKEVTDEIWAQIDCTTCGNCCRTLQIIVDDKDIKRLATRFGITPKQFAAKYIRTAEDGEKHFDSPCPFLEGNACSVYEDRPQACRDFPYLYTPGFRQRTLMMIDNNATCPIVFNVWQTLKGRLWKKRPGRR